MKRAATQQSRGGEKKFREPGETLFYFLSFVTFYYETGGHEVRAFPEWRGGEGRGGGVSGQRLLGRIEGCALSCVSRFLLFLLVVVPFCSVVVSLRPAALFSFFFWHIGQKFYKSKVRRQPGAKLVRRCPVHDWQCLSCSGINT